MEPFAKDATDPANPYWKPTESCDDGNILPGDGYAPNTFIYQV